MAENSQGWLDAQVAVIGSVLLEPKLTAHMLAETTVSDFQAPCSKVYEVIQKLFRQGHNADIVLVNNQLGSEYTQFLMQAMEITPTAVNLDHYISVCREQSRLRSLKNYGAEMAAAESLDRAKAAVTKANECMSEQTSTRVVTMEQAFSDFFRRHQGEKKYLTWPIQGLGEQLYVEAGDFIIIGGYPSAGKSALALQFAWHWAETKRVGFFSFETSAAKLFDRQMAAAMNLEMSKIKRNHMTTEDFESLARRGDEVSVHKIELVNAAGMTVDDIQALAISRRYEIVIVDYLGLIESKAQSRYEAVTAISIGLHTMAQRHNITVVALSQLARADKKTAAEPTMSSLRESGQTEQDADVIFLLYKDGETEQRILKIAKNKEGTLGHLKLDFDGQHQTFKKSKPTTSQIMAETRRIDKEYRKRQAQQQQWVELPPDTPIPIEFERSI